MSEKKFTLEAKPTYSLKEVRKLFEDTFEIPQTSFYRHHRRKMNFVAVTPHNMRIKYVDLLEYISNMFPKAEKKL